MSLEQLFAPKSIAVVGASPDLAKPGGRCLGSIVKSGFGGEIYPVNPRYEAIGNLGCYTDLGFLPRVPDLVAILLPAAAIPDTLRMMAQIGARTALIFSSGFAEAGESGMALQEEVVRIASDEEITILGPNSLGFIDLAHPVAVTFSTAMPDAIPAQVSRAAVIAQSGAMGARMLATSLSEGAAIAKMVSTGNEAVTPYHDFIDYFADDLQVDTLLGFIEGIKDGRALVDAALRARERGKRVAILKVGSTDAGARAARSHTGSMVGSAKVFEAAFRRGGIVPLKGLRDALDLALVPPGAPQPSEGGAGIISTSGGAGVLMADMCQSWELAVPTLEHSTVAELGNVLPAMTGMYNPVDVGPVYLERQKVAAAIELLAADPNVGFVLGFLVLHPELPAELAAIQSRSGKPIFVTPSAGPSEIVQSLREAGIAAFDDLARTVATAANVSRACQPLPRCGIRAPEPNARALDTQAILRALVAEGRSALTERESKDLLSRYGLPGSRERLATTEKEALDHARELGGKLAVKAEAPELLHKSDAGAVRLNVTADDAADAFRHVTEAAAKVVGKAGVRGALIQQMAPAGVEFIAGLAYDPQFGPTITVGLGGVMSEAIADVVTELAPLDLETARSMLLRLRGAALLGPFRGQEPRDVDALARLLVALSEFAMDAGPLIAELDLNPILSHPAGEGCTVVDALVVLAAEGE